MSEPVYTGAYVMGFLSERDQNRLHVDGGSDPADMHVTFAFFEPEATEIDPEQRAVVQYALRDVGAYNFPVHGNVYARAEFNYGNGPEDERQPCSVYLVQSGELASVHYQILSVLNDIVPVSQKFPIWNPHVTAGFNLDITSLPTEAIGPVTFDKLIVAWGDEKIDVTQPLDQAYHVNAAA